MTAPTLLEFSPAAHRYSLDGQRVPSVTTILGVIAKPQLVNWAARTAAGYAVDHWDALAQMAPSERLAKIGGAARKRTSAAAARGTEIHALAEMLLAGEAAETPEHLLAQVQGFAEWWAGSGLVTVASEARVWAGPDDLLDAGPYAGTLDIIAADEHDRLWLLDLKTGSGPWPEHATQLAGYAAADWLVIDGQDTPMPPIRHHGILMVHPDGTTLHTVPADQMAVARRMWDAARTMHAIPTPEFMEVSK